MPSTTTAIKYELASMSGTGDWWFQINYDGSTWDTFKAEYDSSNSGYSGTVTDSSYIASFIQNGIYAVTGNGLSGTLIITVTYTE